MGSSNHRSSPGTGRQEMERLTIGFSAGLGSQGSDNSFRSPLCNTSSKTCPASSSSAQSMSNTIVLMLTFRILGSDPEQFAFLYKSSGDAGTTDLNTDFENHWSSVVQVPMTCKYFICISFLIHMFINLHNNVS